ncbi:NAD(P)H-flavin reductase [Pseudoalteromonas sp. NBT06-2]|uniref:NAD(P)H-flavin reductase n=1 Tax=Pseudoalteromonas sp. NBT06-2 TaxID=2025950 RepID=UPI000BA687F7|nr:NAD(P)H-flavin reductase [Pseudoalteromonas sp. NBT06-2]PAJ73799.1 NAD(P)H-flavin reductase [Pseudoalteromonas sp. NBT06-2]
MQALKANIAEISPLTEFVFKVALKPEQPAKFSAGQYLKLVLNKNDKRAFSIASRPSQLDLLELHIGVSAADSYAQQSLDYLISHQNSNSQVELEVGLGHSYLQENSNRPIILLAGGTGFSYVKSMADHLTEVECDRPVFLYWGVKDISDLYALKEMQNWANSSDNFNFIPVVEQAKTDWQGATGFVHQAVMKDIISLESYDIYMAGRFDMIGIVRDDFIKKGASIEHMYADAFAFI